MTRLLLAWSGGNEAALEQLIPLVYGELRREARARLRRERASHTLQPTALVHEVYLRLIDQTRVKWQNRAHFYGVASRVIREVLVDYARARRAAKRGGTRTQISLEDANPATPSRSLDLALRQEVASSDPANAWARRAVARAHERLADIEQRLGHPKAAEAHRVKGRPPAT